MDEYAFEVRDTKRRRSLEALSAICAIAASVSLVVGNRARRRRQRDRQSLPDISLWRLAALDPELRDLAGSVLDDRFELSTILVRGGFGVVVGAQDRRDASRCAVKIFPKELSDEWRMHRFQHEVAALEKIAHPHVVKIRGHGVTPSGAAYLAMEFIEGMTLRDLLAQGKLERPRCGRFLRQIGQALAALHAHGIYHRDVKPENVMIRDGAAAHASVVLIDFSLALVKDEGTANPGLTYAAGTPRYMAPEQAVGIALPESDVYSLAKLAVEMIAGQDFFALLPEAGLELPARLRESAALTALSPASIDLLASALEFDPARRPADVSAFAEQIARDLESGG